MKECEHDYLHPIKKGRANLRCPKCDKDITLELLLMLDGGVIKQEDIKEEV